MPTYVYMHTVKDQLSEKECERGEEFELTQSIHDDRLKFCPDCNMPVKRLIGGGVNFKFKGGSPTPRFH